MKKRATLSFRLMVTMVLIVFGTVVIGWFLNSAFLEKYYFYNKQKELLGSFREIDAAASEGILGSSDFDIPFERICTNGNISIIIMNQNGGILRSSALNEKNFLVELSQMIFGVNPNYANIIKSTEDYTLERLTDERMQSDYLVLWGILSDGSYIYMRTALESIRESAAITNRFFLWMGIASSLLCVIVIIFVSKSISRPIMELSEISKKMSKLDIDVKYKAKRNTAREIDQLGNHMNELSEKLELTISELKAANNELLNDIERKEQIDSMRKEFLSNVSHELKTPLALIQGYAEGLTECVGDDDPENRRFYCDVIVDESAKMNRMVQKLLTLNQLEFGNDVVEMTRFNITELIAGVVQATARLAEQENIRILFEEQEAAYVWADEVKVEEVITNFLSNAMHYAQGEKVIRIFYTRKAGVLRISVYNTGKQIPEEDIDRIWDKFYKVDKARTREYGGSGIGLSIVKAIMDSFHQPCGVSNHTAGVEFWIELENDNPCN